jgi:hypothetical protein
MATNGSGRRDTARTRPSPAAGETTPSTPSRRASRAAPAEGTPDTSARRVLTILRYLAQHQRPVLASAIARDCHFPRSSTYRLLHVMADERFVTYYPDEGRWGLGLSSYELGTGYLLSDPLARQSMSILVSLAAQTGAFMAIGVLDGTVAIVSGPTTRSRRPRARLRAGPALPRPPHRDGPGAADRPVPWRPHRPLRRPPVGAARTTRVRARSTSCSSSCARPRAGFAQSPIDLADGIWAFAAGPERGRAGRRRPHGRLPQRATDRRRSTRRWPRCSAGQPRSRAASATVRATPLSLGDGPPAGPAAVNALLRSRAAIATNP